MASQDLVCGVLEWERWSGRSAAPVVKTGLEVSARLSELTMRGDTLEVTATIRAHGNPPGSIVGVSVRQGARGPVLLEWSALVSNFEHGADGHWDRERPAGLGSLRPVVILKAEGSAGAGGAGAGGRWPDVTPRPGIDPASAEGQRRGAAWAAGNAHNLGRYDPYGLGAPVGPWDVSDWAFAELEYHRRAMSEAWDRLGGSRVEARLGAGGPVGAGGRRGVEVEAGGAETVEGRWRVRWTIHLDAASPEAAAREALNIHRDPDSLATVFEVKDVVSGRPAELIDGGGEVRVKGAGASWAGAGGSGAGGGPLWTGGECPACGSGDLEGSSWDLDGGVASQGVTCGACGVFWRACYRFDVGLSAATIENSDGVYIGPLDGPIEPAGGADVEPAGGVAFSVSELAKAGLNSVDPAHWEAALSDILALVQS